MIQPAVTPMTFLIMPDILHLGPRPRKVRAGDNDALQSWRDARIRDMLVSLADTITKQILPIHGGKILSDPTGFGIKDHPHRSTGFLILAISEDGAKAIQDLDKKLIVQKKEATFPAPNPYPGLGF